MRKKEREAGRNGKENLGRGWHIDICGRLREGRQVVYRYLMSPCSTEGKRYEKDVDSEGGGGENKKIRKSKRPKREKRDKKKVK